MSSPPLIAVKAVAKQYPDDAPGRGRWRTLWRLLMGRSPPQGRQVLSDISFTLQRGESLGIVGVNGAGKSTLLKIIAGVMQPSAGGLEVNGRVAALLELGAGFQPEQSGLDNVRMKAALLGLSGRELRQRMTGILEFADIGDAIHRPVKHYSSGMVVRLGFAVIASIKPDILITDEVLAVGDESFQRKCIRWLDQYLADGGTLVLVSHSMYQMRRLCQRAIWLHEGQLHMGGGVDQVTQSYLSWHEEHHGSDSDNARQYNPSTYQVKQFDTEPETFNEEIRLAMGQALTVRLRLHSPDGRMPVAGVGVTRKDGTPVYGVASQHDDANGQRISETEYDFTLTFPEFPLLPGQYLLHAHALDPEGVRLKDSLEKVLTVTGQVRELGLVRLPHRWLDL